MEHRSEEWLLARCGSLGGSKIGTALSTLKRSGEPTKEALDFMYELAAERLTGVPAKRVNPLQWGKDHEDEARAYYAFSTNAAVVRVGLIPHPTIVNAHASPDALIGDDGGLEVKCPTSATHLQTLLAGAVPEDHMAQIYWNLACSGRAWWDFISYDPRFQDQDLQVFIRRVERDKAAIRKIEAQAVKWLAEVDLKLAALRERYPAEAA
jgi:putative phage-type endonuclease